MGWQILCCGRQSQNSCFQKGLENSTKEYIWGGGEAVTISLKCISQARNDLNLVVVLGLEWKSSLVSINVGMSRGMTPSEKKLLSSG